MRKSRIQDEPEQQAEWLLTYSDMVTLLLTFFVMLFSMSTIGEQKFNEIAKSFKSAFGSETSFLLKENAGSQLVALMPENGDSSEQIIVENNASENNERITLEELKNEVQDTINELELDENIKVIEDESAIILRMDSVILFDSGDATLKKEGKEVLSKLSEYFNKIDNQIEIQGHTDNVPINTYLFPTNWELSTKRATNVVLYLTTYCSVDPLKLKPSGRGEYYPVAPNDTPENRQKNRRIDIIIQK